MDYAKFDRATGHMSAFAVLRDGKPVGRVVIRPGRDGAARLTAYAQVWGAPMAVGYASGYGYDKRGAALSQALQRLKPGDHYEDARLWAALLVWSNIGHDHDQYESIRRAFEASGYTLATVL